MMVFWTASEEDFCNWTKAFREICDDRIAYRSRTPVSPIASDVPLPELTESNYFVGTVYMCLLPNEYTITDILALETDREGPAQGTPSQKNDKNIKSTRNGSKDH